MVRESNQFEQRPSPMMKPPRHESFCVGAVILVQAPRTKEAMARTRRAIGRRDMGAFSVEGWPAWGDFLGREDLLVGILGSRRGA